MVSNDFIIPFTVTFQNIHYLLKAVVCGVINEKGRWLACQLYLCNLYYLFFKDREEKAAKAITPQVSPPHAHIANALSPQESIQEEPETEINEILPLMQRLQMLKNKQETNSSDLKPTVRYCSYTHVFIINT